MHALNAADKTSAQVTFVLALACLVRPAAVEKLGRYARDLNSEGSGNNLVKNSIVITPKFSGLNCDFDGDCLWTWDNDNFTEAASGTTILPGQNGFYRTSGEEVVDFHYASSKNFFGPTIDSSGSKKGKISFQL